MTVSLSAVAVLAPAVTHPASSCGITLWSQCIPRRVAASSELAKWADELQLHLGEGPCLHAMSSNVIVHMPALGADDRWGRYRGRAGSRVCSSLSLPLAHDGDVMGAVNLYASSLHRFTDREIITGAAFAEQAAQALAIVRRLHLAAEVEGKLRVELAARGVIEQAVGIIMARRRCPWPATRSPCCRSPPNTATSTSARSRST